jgi:NADPH:quinone reductase-like Zn-dependent oxidoreductase
MKRYMDTPSDEPTTRRDFLRVAAVGAAGAMGTALVPAGLRAQSGLPGVKPDPFTGLARPPRRSLRVLVLGGTGFIGPHLVRTLLARGHTPVLFNRGRTEPQLFAEQYAGIENLVGDRNGDISALASGRWDAVIDDSGYTPDQVRATAELLRDRVGQYLFTSRESGLRRRLILRPRLAHARRLAERRLQAQVHGPAAERALRQLHYVVVADLEAHAAALNGSDTRMVP